MKRRIHDARAGGLLLYLERHQVTATKSLCPLPFLRTQDHEDQCGLKTMVLTYKDAGDNT